MYWLCFDKRKFYYEIVIVEMKQNWLFFGDFVVCFIKRLIFSHACNLRNVYFVQSAMLELLAIVGESQKFLIFFALFAHLENSSCEQ